MQQKEAPEVLKSNRISEETVKALSSFKDEPGGSRRSAWRRGAASRRYRCPRCATRRGATRISRT